MPQSYHFITLIDEIFRSVRLSHSRLRFSGFCDNLSSLLLLQTLAISGALAHQKLAKMHASVDCGQPVPYPISHHQQVGWSAIDKPRGICYPEGFQSWIPTSKRSGCQSSVPNAFFCTLSIAYSYHYLVDPGNDERWASVKCAIEGLYYLSLKGSATTTSMGHFPSIL